MKTKLVIEFDNQKAAKHFALWLCGSGEQHYWDWMECREEEEDGNITAVNFDYHAEDKSLPKDDPKRYGEFVADNTIRTTCDRLDRD